MVVIKRFKEKYAKCMSCYEKENLLRVDIGKSSGNRTGIYICKDCANALSDKLKAFVQTM